MKHHRLINGDCLQVLKKLFARKEAGTIKGDGDNR